MIRSQNAKIKNKINIHFAFSERPDPHQLKFVQFFSTQPISNYFTLQGYIALRYTYLRPTYIRNFNNWTFLQQGSWDFGVIVTSTSVLLSIILCT